MNDGPLTSIVIPVQNAEIRVVPALRSTLDNSELTEFEVIVVKNGSADRRAANLPDLQDPRVVTLHLRPGQSASRLRNVGISRARAPYIAFLEPDDVVSSHMLSDAVAALDRHPGAGFAFSDSEYIDTSGRVTRRAAISGFLRPRALASPPFERRWQLIDGQQLARILLEVNFTSVSGLVLRRQLFNEIGPFNERLSTWSDFDIWLRLAHFCDALYLSNVALWHQETRTSMSHREVDSYLIALQFERDRWIDRTPRHLVNHCIARCLATVACAERRGGNHLRSTAMLACACAVSRENRWLSDMLRWILSGLRAAGASIRLES